jgi:hypothetical protein
VLPLLAGVVVGLQALMGQAARGAQTPQLLVQLVEAAAAAMAAVLVVVLAPLGVLPGLVLEQAVLAVL